MTSKLLFDVWKTKYIKAFIWEGFLYLILTLLWHLDYKVGFYVVLVGGILWTITIAIEIENLERRMNL